MENIISDIYENYKDRLKNPLLPTFIGVFVLKNWDHFLILLYSNSSIEVRIKDFYPILQDTSCYLYSLLLSFIYIFFFPFLSIGFSWYKKLIIYIKEYCFYKLDLVNVNFKIKIKNEQKRLILIENEVKTLEELEKQCNSFMRIDANRTEEINTLENEKKVLIKEIKQLNMIPIVKNEYDLEYRKFIANITVH